MGLPGILGAISDIGTMLNPPFLGPIGQPIVIDVLESESPEYGCEITRDPVECGSDITDHILEKPESITLDCVFTNFQASIAGVAAAALSAGMLTWYDKQQALYKILKASQPIVISTPMGFYMGYVIESISPMATAQSGDCFRCRVVCTKINVVASVLGVVNIALLPPELAMATVAESTGAVNKAPKGPAAQESGTATDDTASGSVGNTGDAYGY